MVYPGGGSLLLLRSCCLLSSLLFMVFYVGVVKGKKHRLASSKTVFVLILLTGPM